MSVTPQMFGTVKHTTGREPPLPLDRVTVIDWDAVLSLDMIRQHTKTDDVPQVTDDQLRLYRKAAVEAAEKYTGLMLSKQITVTEPIRRKSTGVSFMNSGKSSYKYRLQYPVSDGVVYVYGGRTPDENRTFLVPKNTRTITVPVRNGMLDMSNCCDPCAANHLNDGLIAMYKAGFACAEDVPATVLLGILQFLAWVCEHPGDELLTQRNTFGQREGGTFGSNNIAMASGALETWRQVDPEAI